MKKLFTILAVAATLVSCAKEDVVREAEGEAIQFGNAFVENSTRAAADPSLGTTANPFEAFNVWGTVGGVAIYAGDVVTKGTGDVWSCAGNKQYWISGASYKFAAVAGVDKAKVSTDTTTKLPSKVVVDAADANVDLLYAEPVSRTGGDGNGAVAFNFKHLLSKVKFTVNNSSTGATGYSFMIDNIKVNGSKTGTIVLADKSWESKGDAADYEITDITVGTGVASVESAKELLLIPGSFTVNFDIVYLCNNVEIARHDSATNNVTLVGGNAYNLTIGVNVGEEITFSAEQIDWDNQDPTPLQ